MRKKMTYLLTLFLFCTQIQASDNLSANDDVCSPPSNIQITSITTYSIDFEWEDGNTDDTSSLFQYTITEDMNPIGGPTTTETQGSSIGYMPLSPSTTYNLHMRTLCMGTWSDWESISFTTESCDTVDMPYIQDFETLIPFFNLVECTSWEVNSGNYWTTNQSNPAGFEGNTLSYPTHQTQDADSWYIIQNGINIEADDKVRVSFKYASDGNGTEKLRLFMATSINDLTNGNGMQLADLTFSDDTVTEYVAGPVPFNVTDTHFFGFQAISDADQGTIYIDDFRVEEWVCGVPDEIEINDILANEAVISWIPTGENFTHFYEYVVSTNSSEPEEGSIDVTATGTNINQIEYLDPNTVYYLYVRAFCSGVWSDWSEPVSFTTLCDSSILLPVGDAEQTLSEGQTLANLDVDGENLTWYSDEELMTEIEDDTVVVNGITYYVTQTIDGCTGEAIAITVTINDVCSPPFNIQITSITTYSIDFEWEDSNTDDTSSLFQYTITEDMNPIGGPTTTETQGSSIGYMPLSPSTTYNLHMRTLCMGTWSDWESISFTTESCDTVDMPYIQDFETLTPFFNLVECTSWDVISGNYWTVNQTSIIGFDGNTLSYPTHQTQDANSWYIIQNGINIEADDKVRVSFKYASDGNGTEKLRLFMATSINDLTNGNGMQLADLTFSDDTVTEYIAGPVPFTETDTYYFGFQATSDANQGIIYIDDFRVEEWVCGVPDEIEINDILANEAVISWVPSGNNTIHFYQYVVSTTSSEPEDGSANIISTGTNINQVENLDSNTVYYVYVRSSCSGVWSDWSEPVSFTTLCDSSILLPVGDAEQTLSEGQTLADLDVNGENLTWYSDEQLMTEIEDDTVVVSGTTYYVTQTIDGCTSEAIAITVTINDPCADITSPTGNTEQTLSEGQTLANLDVDGENLTWYSDEELMTEIEDDTVVVNATTYYVTQTIDGCTSEALAITVEVTLSVSVIDNTTFKVYPNPVKDLLNISYGKDINSVEIINILGQTIISRNVNANHTQIDVSELPSGNYFVKVNVNGAIKTKKIIK